MSMLDNKGSISSQVVVNDFNAHITALNEGREKHEIEITKHDFHIEEIELIIYKK